MEETCWFKVRVTLCVICFDLSNHIFVLSGGQSDNGFNTGPYGNPPLKIKILKSRFLHAREDQKIALEPKFHVPRSSNGKD